MNPEVDRWFLSLRASQHPVLRLYCFPHAGGAASAFARWAKVFAEADIDLVAVQYPGRENRLAEEPETRVERIAGPVAAAVHARAGGVPFAFLGHSMGATLAFETLRWLQREGQSLPFRLFLSGRRPPHHAVKPASFSNGGENAVIEHVAGRYGGIDPEVIAHPEMRALVARVLEADLSLLRNYDFRGEMPATSVPFTVLGGCDDATVDATMLQEWQRYTAGECSVHRFSGGHFFLYEHPLAVRQLVEAGRAVPALTT